MQKLDWVTAFEKFFQKAEMRQCLKAFQLETMLLPRELDNCFERHLRCLADSINKHLNEAEPIEESSEKKPPENKEENLSSTSLGDESNKADEEQIELRDERMREIVQNTSTKDEMNKAMDDFVNEQRKEIDKNNREEFLMPAAGRDVTCARADANGINRGVQIQLDVVYNDSGALERSTAAGSDKTKVQNTSAPLDGLAERVNNINEHLNVKYSPSSISIFNQVRALEDKIMQLERDFPPWAATHFNQPGRRYTQPPPATIYRVLPVNGKSQRDSASTPKTKSINSSPKRPAPRSNTSASSLSSRSTKRQKISSQMNLPVDKTGKPIFHVCGRGVNSSLTRTVLAQLQSHQAAFSASKAPKSVQSSQK